MIAATTAAQHPVWHYALVPAVGVLCYLGLRISELRRDREWEQTWSPRVAAGATAASALIHLSVCPGHFSEWVVYGFFFLACASAQLGWAALVWRQPSARLMWLGAAGSAGLLLLWTATRTTGLPLGPAPWHAEAIGWADTMAGVLEAATIAAVVWARHAATRTSASPTPVPATWTRPIVGGRPSLRG